MPEYESYGQFARDTGTEATATDYLHDIHGELVEIRKVQERIANALERIADGRQI